MQTKFRFTEVSNYKIFYKNKLINKKVKKLLKILLKIITMEEEKMSRQKSFLLCAVFVILSLLSFSYNVRIGDALGIWVLGYPEYSISELIVGPEGDITVPPLGRIKAEGKTLDQLEQEISTKMQSYIKTNKVTVGVVKYAPFPVTVLGNTKVNGVIDIKSEKIKLSDLIGQVGGFQDANKSSYALIRTPDGKEQKVSVGWLKSGNKGEDPYIQSGSFVLFPYDYTNKINVFSDFGTTSLDYYEGISLKSVISVMNIPVNKISPKIVVIRDSQIKEINSESIIKSEDFFLSPGDTVIVPLNYTNKVLVFSDFGTASLDYFEGMGIKSAIALLDSVANINILLNQVNDTINIIRDSKVISLSLDEIAKGKDFVLLPGDTVIINKFLSYVYVNSEEVSKRVDFEKHENMNVRTLLSKIGINEEVVEEVKINNIKSNLDSQLKNGDFVQVTSKRNYVYLTGAFNQTGKISFLPSENITMDKVLGLGHGFTKDFSGELVIIDTLGITKAIKVDTKELSNLKEVFVQPGSTIVANSMERKAYLFGEISGTVEYTLGDTLYELLLPLNLGDAYEIRYQTFNKSGTINASDYNSLKLIPLEGKVFIEIYKKASNEVIVYKAGETRVIRDNIVRIIDVFSAVNGFSPVDKGVIQIYKDGKLIESFNSNDLLNNLTREVPKGSYVIVQPDLEGSYIAVLGNIDPRSIRTDIPISLVEILSGSKIDWKNQENAIIYTEKSEEILVDLTNVDNLRNILVKPGSIVYVPPAEEPVVYVFGEVARPGLVSYNAGMTVLDAILKAGNTTKSAQPSTVYLFKDGPENPPITLDLSGIIKAAPVKTSMNPEIKPKDIIYVPKNALTNVVEVMSTVQFFMSFVNTGISLVGNVTDLF